MATTTQAVPERSIFHRMFWPEDQAAYSAGFSRDQDFEEAITAILKRTDQKNTPFKWRVYWVAALGFLTDSYNLFASNVVLPALSFLYWNTPSKNNMMAFNVATLIGSIVGQVAFGVAVDIYGRRSLYGFELMIVIISTLGLLQCSSGYYDATSNSYTWNITGWLFFWRVIMGIGIGAEYPLSACIAAEWSAKHSRAQMLAGVFLMQPLGQLLAYVVGLIAIGQLGGSPAGVDRFWRIVIGVGAAPTILALFARRLIPESWRFTYFVVKNPGKANFDARNVYDRDSVIAAPQEMQHLQHEGGVVAAEHGGTTHQQGVMPPQQQTTTQHDVSPLEETAIQHDASPHGHFTTQHGVSPQEHYTAHHDIPSQRHSTAGYDISPHGNFNATQDISPQGHSPAQHDSVVDVVIERHEPPTRQISDPPPPWRPGSQFDWKEFKLFLRDYRARLIGMSACWFLLDVAFYGMGFNSPGTLAKLWTDKPIYFAPDAPWWRQNSDLEDPIINATVLQDGRNVTIQYAVPAINDVLASTMTHAIFTTSIAAILGSSVYICTAHLINRRYMLIGTFFAVSILLAVTAGAFKPLFHDGNSNGKVISGGHVVLIFLWALIQFFFSFGPNTLTFVMPAEVFPTKYRCTSYGIAAASGKLGAVLVQAVAWATPSDPNDFKTLQYLLAAFSVCMALGGAIALYEPCVPNVQRGTENKSLEEASNERIVVHEAPKHDDES